MHSLLVNAHNVGVAPDHQTRVDVTEWRGDLRVKRVLVTQIVSFGDDMVNDAVRGECAFEHRCNALIDVALVMHHDPGPPKVWSAVGPTQNARGVLPHTIGGYMLWDNHSPVGFYRFTQERCGMYNPPTTLDAMIFKVC
jgi:hypothetical protein